MRSKCAAYFFSPPGRRWPEGSDEGATLAICGELAPSSRCRDLLPGGEKKQGARARSDLKFDGDGVRCGCHSTSVNTSGPFFVATTVCSYCTVGALGSL